MTTEALNHNLGLPVSRIPTDVLSQIFGVIRDDVTNILASNTRVHPTQYQPLSWIAITQVCHTWRELAIDTPTLWTCIILSALPGSEKWAKKMLYRSKQCSLVVIADFRPAVFHRMTSVSDGIKASLGRCRVLDLRGVDTSILSSLSSGGDLSQLESLRITAAHGDPNPTIFPHESLLVNVGGTVVPYDFISRAKSLRRFEFHNGGIDLHNPSLLHLTWLALYRIPNLTVQSLVAALSKMSALKVLHFMDSTLYTDGTVATSSSSANRVFLKPANRFFLASDIQSVDLFLQHIQLSPTCEVRMKTGTKIRAVTEFGQIASWVSEHFLPPQSDNALHTQNFLQSLCLYIGWDGIEIRAFHDVVSHDKLVEGSPIFDLKFGISEDEPLETLLRPFLASLPLSRIVFLEVSNNLDSESFKLHSAIWMEAFARITTIKTIFLDAGAVGFFSLLHSPEPPFPNLTSITVNDLDDVHDEEILEGLRGRSDLGAPLQEIIFSNHRALPSDNILRQLREVVKQIRIHDFHGVTLRRG